MARIKSQPGILELMEKNVRLCFLIATLMYFLLGQILYNSQLVYGWDHVCIDA